MVFDIAGEKCDYFFNDFLAPRAISTDGTYIYLTSVESVSGTATPTLYVLDPSKVPVRSGNTTCQITPKASIDDFIVASPTTGANTQEILISDDYIFVSNQDANTVSVVSRADFTKVKDITVGKGPFGLGLYSPAGIDTYLYVTNLTSNNVSIIDIATLTLLKNF